MPTPADIEKYRSEGWLPYGRGGWKNPYTGETFTGAQTDSLNSPPPVPEYFDDVYGGKKAHMTAADVQRVKKQILDQGMTSKWKGEGFGSAEANALDMAKSLVASGVTDIKQIGQGAYYTRQPVEERLLYNGQSVEKMGDKYVIPQYAVNGETGQNETIGYKDVPSDKVTKGYVVPESDGYRPLTKEEEASLDFAGGKRGSGFGLMDNLNLPEGTPTIKVKAGEGIINKATGERILSNYNERTTGNAFGGTYSGDGNTAYRVQFDAKGNPIFYTTQHSSNDLANILESSPILNTVANIAANYFGGPLGAAALQLAQGKDVGDAIKAGALSYGAGQIGNYVTGEVGGALSDVGGTMDNIDVGGGWNPAGASSALASDALSGTVAKTAGNLAKSVVQSGGKLDPKNLVTSALSGAGDIEIGDTGINIGNALKGVQTAQALSSGNPLAIASLAAQYLPSGKTSTGPVASDIEPNSFPVTAGDRFPTPLSVEPSPLAMASQQEPEPVYSGFQSTLADIKPTVQKIVGGINMAKSLQSAAQQGPLGMASAFTNIAKNYSSAQPSSVDKLPPAQADVRKLFPVGSNKPPAYVPPSKLTPITSIAGLSKLLNPTG